MNVQEARQVLADFIEAHGRRYDCGTKNTDGSPCHVCTREKKEKAEAKEALSVLSQALPQEEHDGIPHQETNLDPDHAG